MDEIKAAGDADALNISGPHANPALIRRVLVKEVNWLGDLVISLPALRAVRSRFPMARLSVLVKRELAGFFDGIGWVDEVIPYATPSGIGSLVDQWRIISEIRWREFDLAVLFPNSFQSAMWVTIAGVPRRAGYRTDGRALMLTHGVTPDRDALDGHQACYWLGMVRDTLGIAAIPDTRHHRLEVADRHLRRMKSWLAERRVNPGAPLIAIAPTAAYGPAKEWPPPQYATLIDSLKERYGAECVLVGAASERQKCNQVAMATRSGAIIAAGETGIGELIALLSLCDGFAGNDSGAMHLAAALAVPTIGIFGSTNPIRTGPVGARAGFVQHPLECSPCLERTCRFGHYECLRRINPEEVARALANLGAFVISRDI